MKNTYVLLIIFFFCACGKKSHELKITDFSTAKYDTLFPSDNNYVLFRDSYAVQLLKIKGKSNDTILINFGDIEKKYVGNFEDKWNVDYSGGIPVGFKFDPYRADKGEVFVSYSIQ